MTWSLESGGSGPLTRAVAVGVQLPSCRQRSPCAAALRQGLQAVCSATKPTVSAKEAFLTAFCKGRTQGLLCSIATVTQSNELAELHGGRGQESLDGSRKPSTVQENLAGDMIYQPGIYRRGEWAPTHDVLPSTLDRGCVVSSGRALAERALILVTIGRIACLGCGVI